MHIQRPVPTPDQSRDPARPRWAALAGALGGIFRRRSADRDPPPAADAAWLRLAAAATDLGTMEWDLAADRLRLDRRTSAIGAGLVPPDTWVEAGGPQAGAWLDAIHPEDRIRRTAAFAALMTGGDTPVCWDYRLRRPDGTWAWLVAHALVVARDPVTRRPRRAIGVMRDATAARADSAAHETTAATLRDSEARRRLATDTGRIGLVVLEHGPRGPTCRHANRACLEIVGHAGGDPSGRTLADLVPACAPALAPLLDRAFAGERQSLECTPPAPPARSPRRLAITFDPSRDEAGTPLVVGVVVDVTDRRKIERRLHAKIAAREAAQARVADAERMQALGRLAGGMAHDFNNVLQTVQEAADLIAANPAKAETVALYARMIGRAADRGISVTRRLLAFARRGELAAEVIEVRPLLENLCEMLRFTLGAAIAVACDAGDAVPALLADRGQTETALVNLATNARDAMPAGGLLRLAAAAEQVAAAPHPAGLSPGAYVRLSVTDNGDGMGAATLARVTEPFFTTKPAGLGTGLGLAMARGFAEQSGGGLAIDSAPGAGTTVTLWLPAAATGAATPAPSAPARHHAPSPVHVLLVDDDAMVRETLLAQLQDQGFPAFGAAHAAAALALLDDGAAVDVLVTDLAMPGMDGIGLIREARQRRPGLPAILLTGTQGTKGAPALGETVPPPFLVVHKPVRSARLAEGLAEVLGGAADRQTVG